MEAKVFASLDRDLDGTLRPNEIKQLFFNLGGKITDEEVSKLIATVAAGAGREIDEHVLSQFIVESSGPSNVDEATELFKAISKTHKGLVTADEIRITLESNGVPLTEEEAGELVLQHKKRNDTPKDTLTIEEFIAVLS
jgi:Ca2+-binding EF-hand superfamily protein